MRKAGRFLKRLFLFILLAHWAYIVALKWVNPPITLTQFNSWIAREGLKREYISWEEIPTSIKLAVVASEDQLFAQHTGFDKKSIQKALEFNQKNEGKKLRGASTISQQTAKNVFLWQGRSWFRKGLETYFTLMIEWIWGKERILEIYLNVIEMGPGIYGIEAAAQHYYNKSAYELTRAEAARIAVALPQPKKYQVNPPSNYVLNRADWVLRQMRQIEGDTQLKALID